MSEPNPTYLLFLQVKFYWNTVPSFTCCLWLLLCLHGHVEQLRQSTMHPKPKIFPIWPVAVYRKSLLTSAISKGLC